MTLSATPTMTVAGVAVGLARGGTVTAVDELTVHWGRSDLFSQPTPADLACRLLETTADGRPVLGARTDLIGQDVVASWTGSDVAGATVMFRGRITDVEVTPADVAGGGWFISLTASSKEVEAANFTVPAGAAAWPFETFAQRLARIVALLPARMFPGGVKMPISVDLPFSGRNQSLGEFDVMGCAPVSQPSGNVLDLLRAHSASLSPLPLVYDPAVDGFTFSNRRLYENGAGPHPAPAGFYLAGGKYRATAKYVDAYNANVNWPNGGTLDATTMPGGKRQLVHPLESRITNVEVTFFDTTAGYAQKTVSATTADSALEATVGRRTLSISSNHTALGNATNLATMYADLAGGENRQRRLSGVAYDTGLAGGFATRAQMNILLAGREVPAAFFIAGSWLPRAGKRPMVGMIGGTIRYASGEWHIEGNASAVYLYQSTRPLTVAGSQAPGVTLKLADLDSTTFGDAGYLEVGAGYDDATQPNINVP